MKALIIGANSVRRLLRERSNIFFVFILPMLLILVLGAAFGGSTDLRVGMVDAGTGPLGQDLSRAIVAVDGLDVSIYEDRDGLILSVERGRLDAGVVIPSGYDATVRAGGETTVEFVARPEQSARALRNTVDSAVAQQGTLLQAAVFAAEQRGVEMDRAWEDVKRIAREAPGFTVRQESAGEPFALEQLGKFDLGAYSELILFIFLISMTGSAALIQSRQLGVSRRMLSTPIRVRTILAGEALGRFAVALVQGTFIMVGSSLIFGVEWGSVLGAGVIMIVFSFGAAASGMLMGAVFKNDQQAGGLGVVLGLGLAALGGCMMPLSIIKIFSPVMWRVAHVTPHAWGIEAFEELILRNGTLLDILPQLGVLSAFAVVVFSLATWRLRVVLTSE